MLSKSVIIKKDYHIKLQVRIPQAAGFPHLEATWITNTLAKACETYWLYCHNIPEHNPNSSASLASFRSEHGVADTLGYVSIDL